MTQMEKLSISEPAAKAVTAKLATAATSRSENEVFNDGQLPEGNRLSCKSSFMRRCAYAFFCFSVVIPLGSAQLARRTASTRLLGRNAGGASNGGLSLLPSGLPGGGLSGLTPSGAHSLTHTTFAPLPSVPRNAMGFLCQDNPLVEELGTRCRTMSRSIGPLGCDRRIIDLAQEVGRSIDSIPTAFRTARVADACPESCGLCELCAPGCAAWFIGNGYCEADCNVAQCQFDGGDCWDSDCVVGDWSDWSDCSTSCDADGTGGVQTRSREIVIPKTLNGGECPPLTEMKRGCNRGIPCPVDCELGDWGDWSTCSSDCGPGEERRTRDILVEPAHGGKACKEVEQIRPCMLTECPKECVVSPWSAWSDCSTTCGLGTKVRSRTVLDHPVGSDNTCPKLFEETPCLGTACDGNVLATACRTTPWSPWSTCSVSCGSPGTQSRTREFILTDSDRSILLNSIGVADCASTGVSLTDTRECFLGACPINADTDCRMSPWSEWSACDAVCGPGRQQRSRLLISGPENICNFHLSEARACTLGACDQDCEVGSWSDWTECATPNESACGLGIQTRSRAIVKVPVNAGKGCPALLESRDCHIPCPAQCKLGSWSAWSSCSDMCQTEDRLQGRQLFASRWRNIDYYGENCPSDLIDLEPCGPESCPEPLTDLDCVVSSWSDWSSCSASCDGGTRSRTRQVLRPAAPGGASCPTLMEFEDCGSAPCGQNCSLSEWSPWGPCSETCGTGTTSRSREILRAPTFNGAPCGPLEEVAPCIGESGECPRDCELSSWGQWSECSQICGVGGVRYRERHIIREPVRGGAACEETLEIQSCAEFPCDIDCAVSEWSDWDQCSIECSDDSKEVGVQQRRRMILVHASGKGAPCPADLEEERVCPNMIRCTTDCAWSTWGDWTECSTDCGPGTQTRRRTLLASEKTPPEQCGADTQEVPCLKRPCPEDCETGPWGQWSECSAACGGGFRHRQRVITNPPRNNGLPCPDLVEYEVCHEHPCPSESDDDCKVSAWGSWSECSATCGGGVMYRTRDIVQPARRRGKHCPTLRETRGCALRRCPGVPCQDNVAALAANGVTCAMLKAQGCETNIRDVAAKNNLPYPDDMPPEARVKDACPLTCDVCKECAPGCELRDVGNTMCDESCNNEACSFDLGDCGSDCKLPLPFPSSLSAVPAATGLEVGQNITIKCASDQERFRVAPEVSHALVQCIHGATATDFELQVHPKNVFEKVFEEDGLRWEKLDCIIDPCPFIAVSGFDGNYVTMNGLYERVPKSLRTAFAQNPHSPDLAAVRGAPHSLELIKDYEHVETVLHMLNLRGKPAGLFAWSIAGDGRLAAISGPRFHVPGPGKMPLYSLTIEPQKWVVGESFAGLQNVVEGVQMRCIDRTERSSILQRRKSDVIVAGRGGRIGEQDGKPVTYLIVSGMPEKKLYCEDQPEVPQIAGMSCDALVSALGCDFLLKDANRELPPYLPLDTTVALVCPQACDLCGETCAPGCPDYFLGNRFCDPACNVAGCEFDKGDCSDVVPASFENGVIDDEFVTYLMAPGIPPRRVTCQDQPEVPEIAGMQCIDIVDSLGCDFRLGDTGRTLPDFLPPETLVAQICPGTCEICFDDCAPGCVEWFRGNHFCDAACNNPKCNFDNGDCEGISPGSEAVPELKGVTGTSSAADRSWDTDKSKVEIPTFPDKSQTRQNAPPEASSTTDITGPPKKTEEQDTTESLTGDLCEDDPAVVAMQYTCSLLKAVAKKKLNKGCEATLLEVAATQGQDALLPPGVPPITRILDACPVTCAACADPSRLRRPRKNFVWTPKLSLADGEFPNCIDDPRVQMASGMTCKEVVYSLNGRCDLRMADLAQRLPADIDPDLQLAAACGHSCGKCPACEDNSLVAETAGYSCGQIVDLLNGDCSVSLRDLGSIPEGIPLEATLAHACPKSCGFCSGSTAHDNVQRCEDHPSLESLGLSCRLLTDVAMQDCSQPLLNMGVNPFSIPPASLEGPALSSTATLADICSRTCGTCSNICSDSALLASMNQTCSTLIQAGVLGCQTRLKDLAGEDKVPRGLAATLRVADVCNASCGLCNPQPRCNDGFQNGDEEGIDCGGSKCRPCRSCSSGPLKALGPAYSLEGAGVSHMSTRRVTCAAPEHESFSATTQEETIYCVDGAFTRVNLQCGEKRLRAVTGSLRLLQGQHLGQTALPSIAAALRGVLRIAFPAELRIRVAGDCGELLGAAAPVCEDSVAVTQIGYDCGLLSRLGCSVVLTDLAAQQGVSLPSNIPAEATIGDACPVSCNSCELYLKRLAMYAAESGTDGIESATDCLRVDYMIRAPDLEELLQDIREELTDPGLGKQFISIMTAFFRVNDVRVEKLYIDHIPVMVSGDKYITEGDVQSHFTEPVIEAVPRSIWNNAFSAAAPSPLNAAAAVFIDPGVPLPVLDAVAVPSAAAFEEPQSIVGLMYRPFGAVGVPLPLGSTSPDGNAALTGPADASTSAAPISPIVARMKNVCSGGNRGCCLVKYQLQRFLAGPCGTFLYRRVVTDDDMESFCYERRYSPQQSSFANLSDESSVNDDASMVSCFEAGLNLLDEVRSTAESGPACELMPYAYRLMHGWCAQAGLRRALDHDEKDRQGRSFCFPTLKSTLTRKLDFYAAAALSDEEMENMCESNSCFRHHLRYVDALVQLQLGWAVSDAPGYQLETGRRRILQAEKRRVAGRDRCEASPFLQAGTAPDWRKGIQGNSIMADHLNLARLLYKNIEDITVNAGKAGAYLLNVDSDFGPDHRDPHKNNLDIFSGLWDENGEGMMLSSDLLESLLAGSDIVDHQDSDIGPGATAKMERIFEEQSRILSPKRRLDAVIGTSGMPAVGSFVAALPEGFLDLICFKPEQPSEEVREVPMMNGLRRSVSGQGKYCQQTLLLLTDEDPIHNPGMLEEPCKSPCFVPLTGKLGSLLEQYGKRVNNPQFTALGNILRSYGRFYCTQGRRDGEFCGDFLFAKLKSPKFAPHIPTGPVDLTRFAKCTCSLSFINDGQCDPACFNEECGWDGDDCRVPVMFPEVYYALIDTFSEAPSAMSLESGGGQQERLSKDASTTCLFYDPAFTCSSRCRRLYEAGENLQGCCFIAALEALGSLLSVEEQHPIVKQQNRWNSRRSIAYLEQSCGSTFDRTCLGGSTRQVVSVDIRLSNLDLSLLSNQNGQMRSVTVFSENEAARELVDSIRTGLAQTLRLLETDIGRVILRQIGPDIVADLQIDAGRESPRILNELSVLRPPAELAEPYGDIEEDTLIEPLRRRLQELSLESFAHEPQLPAGVPVLENVRTYQEMTPMTSLEVPRALPFAGNIGIGAALEDSLMEEPCRVADLQTVLDEGYLVANRLGTVPEVPHGTSQGIRCAPGYTSTSSRDIDRLQCEHGRWVKQNFLECARGCSWADILSAAPARTESLEQIALMESSGEMTTAAATEAIETVMRAYVSDAEGKSGTASHGTVQRISCAPGFTASRARSPARTKCVDGTWAAVKIACKQVCPPFKLPGPGYELLAASGNRDHGASRTLVCAEGYFMIPAIWEIHEVTTICRDGAWSTLSSQCVRPEPVDSKHSPAMITRLLKQIFTGPGLIGIFVFTIASVVIILIVGVYWKLVYQEIADRYMDEYEYKLAQVAKLAAGPPSGDDYSKKGSSALLPAGQNRVHRKSDSARRRDEEYFGDVELTPRSIWGHTSRSGGYSVVSGPDSRSQAHIRRSSSPNGDFRDVLSNQRRRSSSPNFNTAILHGRAPTRFDSATFALGFLGSSPERSPNAPVLISVDSNSIGGSPLPTTQDNAARGWDYSGRRVFGDLTHKATEESNSAPTTENTNTGAVRRRI